MSRCGGVNSLLQFFPFVFSKMEFKVISGEGGWGSTCWGFEERREGMKY